MYSVLLGDNLNKQTNNKWAKVTTMAT